MRNAMPDHKSNENKHRTLGERWADTSDRRIFIYALLFAVTFFIPLAFNSPSLLALAVTLVLSSGVFFLVLRLMRWRRDQERRDLERYGKQRRND